MRTHAPGAHTLVGYRSHLRDQMEQKHPELAAGSVGKWTPGLTLGCGQRGRDFLSYRQMLQEVCIFMGGAYVFATKYVSNYIHLLIWSFYRACTGLLAVDRIKEHLLGITRSNIDIRNTEEAV